MKKGDLPTLSEIAEWSKELELETEMMLIEMEKKWKEIRDRTKRRAKDLERMLEEIKKLKNQKPSQEKRLQEWVDSHKIQSSISKVIE